MLGFQLNRCVFNIGNHGFIYIQIPIINFNRGFHESFFWSFLEFFSEILVFAKSPLSLPFARFLGVFSFES